MRLREADLSTVIAIMLYVEETENVQKNRRDSHSTHSRNPRTPSWSITFLGLLNKALNSDIKETRKSKIL